MLVSLASAPHILCFFIYIGPMGQIFMKNPQYPTTLENLKTVCMLVSLASAPHILCFFILIARIILQPISLLRPGGFQTEIFVIAWQPNPSNPNDSLYFYNFLELYIKKIILDIQKILIKILYALS